MGDFDLRLSRVGPDVPATSYPPLGRLLVRSGKIAKEDLSHALGLQKRIDARLGDIMVAEGLVGKADVLAALAQQAKTVSVRSQHQAIAPDLGSYLSAEDCLAFGVVPWRAERGKIYVATSGPRGFTRLVRKLGSKSRNLLPVIVDEADIQRRQSRLYGAELARKASTRVREAESCRTMQTTKARRTALAAMLGVVLMLATFFAPSWTITAGVTVAAITLLMTTILKTAALFSFLLPRPPRSGSRAPFRLPRVSILVPLLREREIAGQLIARLSQLTYPKSLLNVVLVLEQDDQLTRETIARTPLPDWMSVIEVPEAGALTTKPRALNYALNFCQGSIIGVWDAEDWPEADQIEKVVSRFNDAPQDVVCLQGQLDYYNSRCNWLTRCFTIEYAIWWRIVMPGIARLGLVVPLGGTTLFFKRTALEKLGGWDAHNVTEDADLGVRLARHGYKTELLPTVTREEATSRGWSWVRQRSRWLKGFLITYLVHMRRPATLLRELGFWRFMGVQTLFFASVVQFAAAPLLWSFWVTLFGFTHPVAETIGADMMWILIGLFIAAEVLNIALGCIAVAARERRHLMAFVPTMMLYFVLGTVAAYKAIWELLRLPFFWDKTQNGVSHITDPLPDLRKNGDQPSA